MVLKSLNEVKLVTSIGAGPIGGGWAAHFLAQGFRVNAYLHSESEINTYCRVFSFLCWLC